MYRLAFRNGLLEDAKRAVSHDETARFRTPNGMYFDVTDNEVVTRTTLFVYRSERFLQVIIPPIR